MRYNLRFILKMALPIALSYLAVGMMNVVDTLIVGNYNTADLAYIGIANTVFAVLYCVPTAMLQGILIHTAQFFGGKKFKSCGRVYYCSVRYAVILSLVFMFVGLGGKQIFEMLGQDEDVCVNAAKLLAIYALSMPAVLYYANANYFLQAIKRPFVGTAGFVLGNLLNLMINPVLTYGWLGAPEMGAAGCALTTLIIRTAMALYISGYIRMMKKNKRVCKHFGFDEKIKNWWQQGKSTRHIGYGLALIVAATNGSFSMVNVFAGWLGIEALAAYTIVAQVNVFVFMIFFALSQATTIVVANTFGKQQFDKLKFATLSGYAVYTFAAVLLLGGLAIFDKQIYGLFSNDEKIITEVTSLILFVIIDLFIDTLPLNIEASLRGINDIKYLTLSQIAAFLFARIGACYLLAFVCGLKLAGLILGLAGGGICSAILNGPRLLIEYKKAARKNLSQKAFN